MRAHSLAAALLATTVFSVAAFAAAPPDNILFAGYIVPKTINPLRDGTWCMIDGINSTFVQSQARKKTLISFSDVIFTQTGSVGPTAYRLGGQSRLFFNGGSTTDGTVIFNANQAYPAAVSQPTFNKYSANYDATTHTLVVKLHIHFPACTLPITAVYRN